MDKLEMDAQVEGARAYDSLFVPALFGQWVGIVGSALNVSTGQNVLDIACGTGVLSQKLAGLVAPSGSVTGLDPNVGMLTVAAENIAGVAWEQGVAESLPFESDTFDCVGSQFGFMFFEDQAAAIKEFLRVAKPKGSIAVAVWDSIENISGYRVEHALINRMAGFQAGAAVAAPFCMGDKANLKKILVDAGAQDVVIQTHKGVARFPDIATMVNAELRGWLPIMGVNLEEDLIRKILAEAEVEMAPFIDAEKSVLFDITAHVALFTN